MYTPPSTKSFGTPPNGACRPNWTTYAGEWFSKVHVALTTKRWRRLPHCVRHGSKVPFVGRNLLANGRGRLLAVAASVVVSAAMIYAQTTERPCCAEKPTAAPATQAPTPTGTPNVAAPAEAELLAASAPVAAQNFQFALPPGVAPEQGLQVKTIWVARAISVMFPEIKTIGGYRQDPLKW